MQKKIAGEEESEAIPLEDKQVDSLYYFGGFLYGCVDNVLKQWELVVVCSGIWYLDVRKELVFDPLKATKVKSLM